jgi:hypothetical protein
MFQDPEIQKLTIAEISNADLMADSGMAHDDGRHMTVLEALTAIEKDLAGGEVYVNVNGALSPEANAHNSQLGHSRSIQPHDKAAQYIVAVRTRRPKK